MALAAGVVLAGCTGGGKGLADGPRRPVERGPAATAAPPATHDRGGSVRVAVIGDPDPGAATAAGAAVRALVLPQLFVARPDGTWAASLVEPGSDRTAPDARSATFRLRPGASWSDGTPITAGDLRRSRDERFVADVTGAGGVVTVSFTQPLPGWRRLWSGADAVRPPADGVWGGPFVVAARTPGLETVLRRNDRWWGAPAPWLDEVRLTVVADETTARLLLAEGRVDVVAPRAATNRLGQYRAISGVQVDAGAVPPGGGWEFALAASGELGRDQRRALAASLDVARFTSVLLRGEATPAPRPAGASLPADAAGLRGRAVVLTGVVEDPMTPVAERAMQRRVRAAGGTLELRNAEADVVDSWLAAGEYEAALVWRYDGPEVCWMCRGADVDRGLAVEADAGNLAAADQLSAKLVDDAVRVPLWRPVPAIAWRTAAVAGVRANPFALSAASEAWQWWRP